MSNTRAWNSRAATLHRQQNLTRNYHRQQPSGGRTRQQPSGSRTYHDRVNLDHDFEVISARETTTTVRGIPLETPRSPQKGRTTWTIGNSWTPQDSADYGLDPSSEWFDAEVEGSVTDIRPPPGPIKDKKKRKKSRVSKRPHIVWKELHREVYLDEMLRWEGRGDVRKEVACPTCPVQSDEEPVSHPEFRCRECFIPDLVCQTCCVRRHRAHPFHSIERWTGAYFVKTSLKALGFRLQLNHVSMRCSKPSLAHAQMRILHTNGIHDIPVFYCDCEQAIPKHQQLLRRGLYPANQINPKTCATFSLLALLHLLALTSKASTYDFYRTLEKSTCNTGVEVPKSRYRALLRMVLQWRHLRMLKRGGRGHSSTGAKGTVNGELAVLCPSCPRPGVTLPADWAQASPSSRFLYSLIICMDANFRLKNQLVSSFSSDPGLGIGMSYMVPREPYDRYILSRTKDDEISTCVGFAALAKQNSKFSKGLRFTGVGAVSCGRSEMILPNAIGNLQKGERYANMDYIFASSIRATALLLIAISYDIACQWFVNLSKRIENHWPDELRPHPQMKAFPVIPKLHEPGHGSTGHEQFSFNWIPGVGLTDGECPERIWAAHNALGNATKTQGPGSRQDVIDDHIGFWNWLKYTGMGKTLMRRYKGAISERNTQVEAHHGLTLSVGELAPEWEKLCDEWDRAEFPREAQTSPYRTEGISLSEAQVQKELADEEETRLASGGAALHETSPSSFISMGLELEEAQRRIRQMTKERGEGATPRQGASITELRNVLRTRIRNWERLRAVYMPGVLQLQTEMERSSAPTPGSASTSPEDADLFLPSQIPPLRREIVCAAGLHAIEERLRIAQCYDALDGIRHTLRVKSRMVIFKNKNIRGQRDGLRSRAVIDRVHQKARAYAAKYRSARKAVLALSGAGAWEASLQPLLDSDIRAYTDPDRIHKRTGRRGTVEEDEEAEGMGESRATAPTSADQRVADGSGIDLRPEVRGARNGTGETRRTLSWIWTTARNTADPDASDNDILRSEWAKSRARAARATEEVVLLREEMRRVLAFLEWKANWWGLRKEARPVEDRALAEGLRAYAEEQAALQHLLCRSFRSIWKTPLSEPVEVPSQGANSYEPTDPNRLGDNGNEEHDEDDDSGSDDEDDEDEDGDGDDDDDNIDGSQEGGSDEEVDG